MAVDIIVQRDGGTRPGRDIVEPLICSQAVALQLGRNLLDRDATATREVRAQVLYRSDLELGQLVTVQDLQSLETYPGKITAIRHSVQQGSAVTELSILRESDFNL